MSLPQSVVAELTEHRKTQIGERLAAPHWEPGDWLFTTTWGAPLDQRADWGEFKDIVKSADLRPARLHDLRHSAATLMLEADTDLRTAGEILGHGSTALTARYTHVLADRRRAAAARLDSLVWGSDAAK